MLKYILIIYVFISFISVQAQTDDEIIAKIGNISISKNEFIRRYELTPQINREMKSIKDALKTEFLYSLIAEKLFALDAINNQLDTNEVISNTLKKYEQMFVRDKLYKLEIKDKSKLYADTLLDKYIDNPSNIDVKYVLSESQDGIFKIYNLLQKGIPFDSLYNELNNDNGKTIKIHIGDLNEVAERNLFSIKEGGYSEPVLTNKIWYIYKILKRNHPVLEKSDGWKSEYNNLNKVARERAENIYYARFMKNFFNGKDIKVTTLLLKSMANKISFILCSKRNGKNQNENLFLEPQDFNRLINLFNHDTLNMVYIKVNSRNIKLKDFLEDFRLENFYSKETDFHSIAALLNSKTKTYIEQKLLTEEGYKQGLQNSKAVKDDYNMWRDNYLYQKEQLKFMNSNQLSDNDAYEYYMKNERKYIKSPEVNIVEVLTDSLEIAEKVLRAINDGEDIHNLASVYSKRDFTKNTKGEFGFFPISMYGEIGRIAGTMRIGEIYGPLLTPDGYSIFKLIGKKEGSYKIPPSFNEQKEEIKKELSYKKMKDSIINYTVKLANKYGIKINDDLLSSISVTSLNAFVYRYLGFGGRITGVPLIAPNMDWVKQWHENVKNVP